jgi:alpha-beta hydrolase superfamily lysophospholipase
VRRAGGGLAVVAVVLLAGPRVPVETEVPRTEVPTFERLEGWLAGSEAELSDLVDGAEKAIQWADPAAPSRTRLSFVYLHGFSANRQESAPLVENLAGTFGANAYFGRLTGHGRSAEAMGDATVASWLIDGEEAMAIGRALGDRVVLIGTSTGGTLASWMALQGRWQDHLAALVLLSPNFGPADPASRILLWPWGGLLARLVIGPTRSFVPENDLQARHWTESYPTRALLPMMGLVDLVAEADLGTVRAPTLVLLSPTDQVIDLVAAQSAFQRIGAPLKSLEWVGGVTDGGGHVLAGDILSPGTTGVVHDRIAHFLEDLGALSPAR